MQETFWALVPPLVAIALALLTKEVYFSLLVGILSGVLFYTNFQVFTALETMFTIMSDKVGGNLNIIIFLVLLGMLVSLMSKSGATVAYGNWASRSIKSKRGALGATAALGTLIFVDDYFNCLTVGTVMSPVTDRFKVSRAKLAYIIDATAAPICIIAPISSWAAAVGSSLPENCDIDGFGLFIKAIPYNLYALLTLVMVVFLIFSNFDYSKMKKYEALHKDDVFETTTDSNQKIGKVKDLVIPILALIVLCILCMLYTGGILEGASIITAFADCSASLALAMGSFFTIILVAIFYLPRKVITFTQFTESILEGFKAMIPAILILTFAWTLSGICGESYLNAGGYVSTLVNNSQMAHALVPALFFLISLGLAFATGTSWGTFGILIPIIVPIFGGIESTPLVISVAAVLAGAVCGDHISPISDTTILSSTGAQCNHMEHVSTQLPYALTVAAVCFVGYLIAGFTGNGWLSLGISIVLLLIVLGILYKMSPTKEH